MIWSKKPIAIYYEHPAWFKPLFAELEKRKIPFVRLNATQSNFNPAATHVPYSLVLNRMSPSAYKRGNANSIFYSQQYLRHVERLGVPTINGSRAAALEFSKTAQLELLASLGLPFPKTKVVNHVEQLLPAAKSIRFPVLIKPNVGGSGAGILRFDNEAELSKAIFLKQVCLGIDSVALVQEYTLPEDDHIVRVETVNGKFVYAIKIFTEDGFNPRAADQTETPGYTLSQATIHRGGKSAPPEAYIPPQSVVDDVERIVQAAGLDVGAVEFLLSPNGTPVYFDINALSNFIPHAPHILGFDPYSRLVDYIEERLAAIPEPDFVHALSHPASLQS